VQAILPAPVRLAAAALPDDHIRHQADNRGHHENRRSNSLPCTSADADHVRQPFSPFGGPKAFHVHPLSASPGTLGHVTNASIIATRSQ
jgi:hypothetical protein